MVLLVLDYSLEMTLHFLVIMAGEVPGRAGELE